MNILDPKFRYQNAAETSQPGYLAAKFKRIQTELEQRKQAQKPAPVMPIRKAK